MEAVQTPYKRYSVFDLSEQTFDSKRGNQNERIRKEQENPISEMNSFDYKINTGYQAAPMIHINNKESITASEGGAVNGVMTRFFAGFPLVSFGEIKRAWSDFVDVTTFKAFFVLIGAFCSLLFGQFDVLQWVLLVMATLHFFLRRLANKYRGTDSYVTFSRSIQLFLWPYILLAAGNTLSSIISFDGLPEGTFLALFLCWIIWGEIKGFVDEAKVCGFPIPPILEKIVTGRNDVDPPL